MFNKCTRWSDFSDYFLLCTHTQLTSIELMMIGGTWTRNISTNTSTYPNPSSLWVWSENSQSSSLLHKRELRENTTTYLPPITRNLYRINL
jgi:hypothetical protein